jgi:hypothetical protein
MRPSCKSAIAVIAAVLVLVAFAAVMTPMFAAPVEETAFGMSSLSVHNQTSQPVQIRVDEELLGVVGRYEYQFFQVPDHLARRPSVTLTARNQIGDEWQVTMRDNRDHYHWSIQPQ